jgi:hypothetical protein
MDDAEVTAARLLRAVHLAVLLSALAALFGLALPGLLRNPSSYRWPAAQFAGFAVLVCVAAVAGQRIRLNRPPGRSRWVLLAGVCAAWVVNIVDIAPSDPSTDAMWSTVPAVWFVLVLLLDQGFRVVTAGLSAALVASVAVFFALNWSDHTSAAEILLLAVGSFGYQVGVLLVAELLRRIAATQARSAREEERLRTASAVADALHRDRRRRYAELGAVPLLAGLAAGVLDPADEQVRASCAAEAARMRRLLAERDDVPDPLLHELRACADTAERKGVTVYLGTCGSYPSPPLAARRALTEPAIALLATAASHARVTVIGSADAVTVSVVSDSQAPGTVTWPAAAGVTTTQRGSGNRLWMEATWRIPS